MTAAENPRDPAVPLPRDNAPDERKCPDRSAWRAFLLGTLAADDVAERLRRHLDVCPHCRQTIAEVDADDVRDDPVLKALRTPYGDRSTLRESAFAHLEHQVDELLAPEAPQQGEGASEFETPVPEWIGRFRIERVRGRGAFGTVYLATDPRLERQVALKVPHRHARMSEELRRRFVWEAQAAARLNHPNLLAVHDAGEIDGVPYIASEYCSGPNLAEALKQSHGCLPPRLAAALVLRLADAVSHAHARGVLHRDIKPRNILLEPDPDGVLHLSDRRYTPKLADFGLARPVLPGETAATVAVSGHTGVAGTPAYMAPEQLSGESEKIDVRTDVFGLGVVLYELLTGRTPYRTTSMAGLLRSMQLSPPEFPRDASAKVPPDLRAICLKCLAFDPDDRYGSAGDLADDLRRFLIGEPVDARPLAGLPRVARWIRRRPAVAALLLLALLVPFVTTAAVVVHNRSLGRALQRAEQSEAVAQEHLYAAKMRLAYQAWRDGHIDQYHALMDAWRVSEASRAETVDPRGLEWTFLESLARRFDGERVWQAHSGGVCCVQFSPHGRLIATSGTDGLIKLWDATSGRLVRTLRGHQGDVNRIAFSHDGLDLASAGDDGTVRLWEVKTGLLKSISLGHTGRVFEVLFLNGDKRFASAGDGADVRFWFRRDGRLSDTVPANNIRALGLHPQMPLLVAAERLIAVEATEYGSGSSWFTVPTADFVVDDLAFSRDGGRIALACGDGLVRVLDTANGRLLQSLREHGGAVMTVQFSPDDHWLAAAGAGTVIKLWDVHGGPGVELRGHRDEVWSLAFSPGGTLLATADRSGEVHLWNWRRRCRPSYGISSPLSKAGLRPVAEGLRANCSAVAAASGTPLVVTTCSEASFRVLDPAGGRVVKRFGTADEARTVSCLALSPGGGRVAVGEASGRLALWDLKQERLVRRIEAHTGGIRGLAFSPDGRLLATAGEDRQVRLWAADSDAAGRSLRLRAEWSDREKAATAVVFAPDGKTLASAAADGSVCLFDLATLGKRAELRSHQHAVLALAFSPCGRYLAGGGYDRRIVIWDVRSARPLRSLSGHRGYIRSLAFSRDGNTLISGGMSGGLKFWRTDTGFELFDLGGPDPAILQVMVAHAGDSFLVVGENKTTGTAALWCWP